MAHSSSSPLLQEARRIAAEFEFPAPEVNKAVKFFREQMTEGLEREGSTLSQIPSFVTTVPDGSEKGLYLAVDLGGTNFRVCSIELNGDSTFKMTQSKVAIPRELMITKASKELFDFLAKQVDQFLQTHHNDHFVSHVEKRQTGEVTAPYAENEIFDLGFTFSFPVIQETINKGRLLRWTKGFDIAEAVDKDICKLLQDALDDLRLPVRVAALINDTVGTLMARSYCSHGKTKSLIGAIFGTGTNGAYVEKVSKIKKLIGQRGSESEGEMVVNIEWGSFDNHLKVLPNTQYDKQIDEETVNPGVQMFEKRVSGMYLGEILRLAILSIVKNPSAKLFASPADIPDSPALYKTWGIDSSFLSVVKADSSEDLADTRNQIKQDFGIDNASRDDCEAVKLLVHAIGKRAARLGAVALAAIVISSGKLAEEGIIDIGVDGSLVEFYPGFEGYIREAFREIDGLGIDGEKKIRIGIAKDGSGVGAALGALAAHTKGI